MPEKDSTKITEAFGSMLQGVASLILECVAGGIGLLFPSAAASSSTLTFLMKLPSYKWESHLK